LFVLVEGRYEVVALRPRVADAVNVVERATEPVAKDAQRAVLDGADHCPTVGGCIVG
jgi:hypothetical protein